MAGSTDPKSYTIELGRHKCLEIIKDLSNVRDKSTGASLIHRDADTDCVLYLGRLTSDGHWQIQRKPRYHTRSSSRSGQNQHRAYYVHRIAFVSLHGRDISKTGSHLCGRGNCINPLHIHDESIDLNVARINCLGFVHCPEHGHRLASLCQHTPPCIKKPILAERCCLLISQQERVPESQSTIPHSSPIQVPASSDPTGNQPPPTNNTDPAAATTFDEFIRLSQQNLPSSGPFLQSSLELFDTSFELASSGASPPASSPPGPIQLPSSPPPVPTPPDWRPEDAAGESQQGSSVSFIP